jgi:predicted nucleic acid-binding protein
VATILESSAELSEKGRLTLVPAKLEFTAASWKIIIRHHISAGDSLQVLSATAALCSVFVAADDLLVKIARNEGFASYNILKEEDSKKLLGLLRL